MVTAVGTAMRALDGWIDGPASLLSERWQAMRPGDRIVARISDDGKFLVLDMRDAAKSQPVPVSLETGEAEATRNALSSVLAEKAVAIVVPRGWVIEREVDLPLEAASHIDGIVASRVSTLSPIPPHETLFGHRVVTVDRAARKLVIGIAILPKARVARAIELVEGAGCREVAVEAASGEDGFVTLSPRRSGIAVARRRVKAIVSAVLGVSVASALAALIAGPFIDSHYDGRRLEFEARAKAARAVIAAAAGPEKAATVPEQAALDLKNESVSALGALEDLAAALPSHSYATQISLADGRIRLAGRTTDLPDVLTALESSGRFLDSKLVGTALRDADGTTSDFELETRPLIRTGGALR